jgi:hypothetical protein
MARPSSRSKQETPARSFTFPGDAVVEEFRIRSPENDLERKHRLRKEASIYIVALLIIVVTAIYCFWVLFHPAYPREDRQWAMSILGGLIGGIVGYLYGRASK